MRNAALAIVLVCVSPCAHADTRITLRGGMQPINAERVTLSESGVHVENPNDASLIGWDHVLEITGDAAQDAAVWSELVDLAFHARIRLERSDWRAAEPLLEELAGRLHLSEYVAEGPTPSMIFDGLARCRVQRRAYASAVMPWLEWMRVRDHFQQQQLMSPPATGAGTPTRRYSWIGGEIASGGEGGASSVIDRATGLCPALPPMWLEDNGVRSIATDADWQSVAQPIGSVVPESAHLAGWYRASMRLACGIDTPLPARGESEPRSVALVADIVTARFGDAEARRSARQRLTGRLEAGAKDSKNPRWVEAWCRAALGRSLVLEESIDDQRRGVVQMLHVPARFGNEQAYLAGVCLAESAAALARMGDADGAAAIKAELTRRYPDHSALAWQGLNGIGQTSSATKGGS